MAISPITTKRPLTQDEKLAKRLGTYTPEMLANLNESEERDRMNRLMVRLVSTKPYLANFLVDCVKHTGREGLRMTKTAGVYVSPTDLSIHIAMNPFFMAMLERVDVKRGLLPLSPDEEQTLTRADYKVITVGQIPTFVQRIMDQHNVEPKGDREWIAVKLDTRGQIAILEHEVRHLLNRHTEQFQDRAQWPDAQVLNIAMDVAINQHIENLPDGFMTIESFQNDPDFPLELPRNETFDVYYTMLMEFYKDAERGNIPENEPQKPALQGFTANTLVLTPRGEVPIATLQERDEVLTVDSNGDLVSRYIKIVKSDIAEVVDTPKRLATDMFEIKTDGGRGFSRISGKSKVWVDPPGPYPWTAPNEEFPGFPWRGAEITMGRVSVGVKLVPPLKIGDRVWVFTPRPIGSHPPGHHIPWTQETVTFIGTEPRQQHEALFNLKIQEVNNISAFFANGIFVRGISFYKQEDGEGDGPPPEQSPFGDDDDFPIPPRGRGKPPKPPREPREPGEPGEPKPGEPGEPKPGEPGEPGGPGEPGEPGELGGDKQKRRKVVPAPGDDHELWDDGPPGRLQREAIKRFAEGGRARAKRDGSWGTTPGDMVRDIENLLKPPGIDWRREFRKLVGQHVKIGHTLTRKRPNRRWGFDFPGRKVVRSSRILVAVDNSGSMTHPELEQIGAEIIEMIKQGVEVVLLVWDTEVVNPVYLIKKPWEVQEIFSKLGGGGGTNVGVVFQALANPHATLLPQSAKIMSKRPELIAVFTDGDLPSWPPIQAALGIPTIWGITRSSNLDKPKFGIVLYVDTEGI